MEVNIFRHTYREGDVFPIFLASDLHCDDKLFDIDRWRTDAENAKKEGARINLNGDILGLILPGDRKRYTRGNDLGDVDDKIGEAVDIAENALVPYADHIDVIGTGNHETAVLKHHSVDATKLLIGFLNRGRKHTIKHGGYTGFIRYVFEHEAGGHSLAYDIYYNHGQGAGEVTDGMIGLKRRQYIRADLIWLGHVHKNLSGFLAPEIGLSHTGQLYEAEKRGVITGTYLRNYKKTDASENGYILDYAEERMRVPQGRGGAMVRLTLRRDGIKARVET